MAHRHPDQKVSPSMKTVQDCMAAVVFELALAEHSHPGHGPTLRVGAPVSIQDCEVGVCVAARRLDIERRRWLASEF